MTVPLEEDGLTVSGDRAGTGLELTGIESQAHRAALFGQVALLGQDIDYGIGSENVELAAVGLLQLEEITRGLDHHDLHAQAEPEIGHAALTRKASGADHALDAAGAKSAGDQDPVQPFQYCFAAGSLQGLRVDPLDLDLLVLFPTRVKERFAHADVGIAELHVLADDADPYVSLRRIDAVDQLAPIG